MDELTVLYVANLRPGYPMRQRYDAMLSLNKAIDAIDYGMNKGRIALLNYWGRVSYWLFRHDIGHFTLLDLNGTNRRILEAFNRRQYDILWLDRALMVEKGTLTKAKELQPDCLVVGFSHDDMARRHNQSRQFLEHLPYYDLFYTTKSYNVRELKEMGCRRCEFIDNSFDPQTHYPYDKEISGSNARRYPVGFIGTWEKEREELFRKLAERGIQVHVWGGSWNKCFFHHKNLIIHHGDIVADEYAKTLSSVDIVLGLLRKMNRDLQTTRSIEIPSCGAFMLAERTTEHQALFEEGKEAEFFASDDELIQKIEFYLAHPECRKRISDEGRKRCVNSGYSNAQRIEKILESLCTLRES